MSALALQVENSLIEAFAVFEQRCFLVSREADHVRTFSGTDEAFLNNVFALNGDPLPNVGRLNEICSHFQGKSHIWRLGPSTRNRNRVVQLLSSFGFMHVGTSPGMLLKNFTKRESGTLHIDPVKNDAELAIWFGVWGEGFGMSSVATSYTLELFREKKFLTDPRFQFLLGRENGKPVCCASSYDDGQLTGVYNVTTVESARRKGYGSAISSRLIEQAQVKFAHPLYLIASPDGFPVYRLLGFETICDFEMFFLPPAVG